MRKVRSLDLQLEVLTPNSRELPLERLAKSPIGAAASTIITSGRGSHDLQLEISIAKGSVCRPVVARQSRCPAVASRSVSQRILQLEISTLSDWPRTGDTAADVKKNWGTWRPICHARGGRFYRSVGMLVHFLARGGVPRECR